MDDDNVEAKASPGKPLAKQNGEYLLKVADPLGNNISMDLATWEHIESGHPELK